MIPPVTNFHDIIFSYNDLIETIISLIRGRYFRRTQIYKDFTIALKPINILDIQSILTLYWDNEDIKQEILIEWARVINSFFGVTYFKTRTGGNCIRKFLSRKAIFAVCRKIKQIVRYYSPMSKLPESIEVIEPAEQEFFIGDLHLKGLVSPRSNFFKQITPASRLAWYRLVRQARASGLKTLLRQYPL